MDFRRTLDTIEGMVAGAYAALPDLLLALLVFSIFLIVARRVRLIVVSMTEQRQKAKNLGLILGRLAQSSVVVAGVLVSLTIIFPSFKPGDLIQLLGIGSVAIGFAFHDLFQNFLAGILLLLTSPFRIGDQIIVEEYEGTVEDIKTRATTIATYDGRRVVIPNADLFTKSVTVNTAFGKRRLDYEVVIDFQNDIEQAKAIILEAVQHTDGVLKEPPPEAFVVALGESGLSIRVYWWTMRPRHSHVLHLQDKVLTAIKNHMVANDVTLPTSSHEILLKTHVTTTDHAHSAIRELLPGEKV